MILPQSTELHLWYIRLDEDLYQSTHLQLLTAEEVKRADNFRFEVHRKQFIMARAGLRSILSLYLGVSAQKIQLLEGREGKPYVENTELQFNLSHSYDLALLAVTRGIPVGLDLEKMRDNYNEGVAQRFFSCEEYQAFSQLSAEEKLPGFFRMWTRKEALIKALGEGLLFPLSSFILAKVAGVAEVCLTYQGSEQSWFLENLDLFPDYQVALATNKRISRFSYFEWTPQGGKKWREDELRSLP